MAQGNQRFFTNQELIAQLSLRNDLTDLEMSLLDRLILACDEVGRLEQEVYHTEGQGDLLSASVAA